MKYLNIRTSFSTVKTEICVAIEITNCPHKCLGCHTPELQQDIGKHIDENNIIEILKPFTFNEMPLFSCVAFMGGDQEPENLISILKKIKNIFPNVSTCLYTGNECVNAKIQSELDYLKVGKYIASLGGLDSPTTNQRFYILKGAVI